jgi:hypothetical protein
VGDFRPGSTGAGKGVNLTGGAQLIERRGRGGWLGKAWSERENVFSVKTRPTHGLDRPAGTILACGDGAAGGLARPEAKRAAWSAGPKVRKRISELKIGFLNLPRLWKFVEGDLGGILT